MGWFPSLSLVPFTLAQEMATQEMAMAQPLPGPVVRVLPYLCLGVCLHSNERPLTLAIFTRFMSDPPFQRIFVVKSFTSPVFATLVTPRPALRGDKAMPSRWPWMTDDKGWWRKMQMDCLWQSPNPILGSFASRFPQVVQELSAKVLGHSGQRDMAPIWIITSKNTYKYYVIPCTFHKSQPWCEQKGYMGFDPSPLLTWLRLRPVLAQLHELPLRQAQLREAPVGIMGTFGNSLLEKWIVSERSWGWVYFWICLN